MIEKTYQQIKKLNIKSNIPLVIVDADEVIVHFAKPFVLFLKKREALCLSKFYFLQIFILERHPSFVASFLQAKFAS